MMDKFTVQTWFASASSTEKVLTLLNVIQEFTLVIRGVFSDPATSCDTRAAAAYRVSELNHRLVGAARDVIQGNDEYARTVIDLLFEGPKDRVLQPYFPVVLRKAIEHVKKRAAV
jgi:hypothetical protein